ncbi:amidohydrolase family protein [Nocardioides speluncae]|uniref:amidohydrolase family protein n=1 Tax=Nocardioides speluncae TaxID=2670337 RepID=UPI000D694109|nr:amidohydrolase family protein [Nocardioides speluncae]
MATKTLVQGGLVIDTAPEVTVRHDTDVLIEDGRIAAVGPGLAAEGAEVIDARGRIVLPGFVDTHRHLWQTALRGLGVGGHLGYYFQRVIGPYAGRYRPEDVAASNLVGALECLDGGVTTVQDYSHVNGSAEHAEAGLAALDQSGIRAVFGIGPSPLAGGAVDPAAVRHVLGSATDRVTVAVASLGPAYAPFEVVDADWALAAELGLPVVTHLDSSENAPTPIALLRDAGLLRPDALYVHGNNLPESELKLIADSGASVSVTPVVEARLRIGDPIAPRLKAAGVGIGLGIDTVACAAGDMFTVMQQTLALGHDVFTAAEVLQLATVGGARALGLAEVGSLAVGNQADLVLLRSSDVNLAGGLHDPVTTVVASAQPGNVETVLVAGTPVKRDGRLVSTPLDAAAEALSASLGRLAA